MPAAPSSHFAFMQPRLPAWLAAATPTQRETLERLVRGSHRAMRHVQALLRPIQTPSMFCRTRLEDALAHAFPERELPDIEQGWLLPVAGMHGMSWLEAGMQNFEAQAQVRLYLAKDASGPTTLDPERFIKVLRNLDLGEAYQYHLNEHLGRQAFLEALQAQDRAAFAAELYLARLKGALDDHGAALGDAVLAGLSHASRQPLECSYLSLFDMPMSGPLLIRKQPRKNTEACLLYLPGHPTQPLRQYDSLKAVGQAITEMLWQDHERQFFLRYVKRSLQPAFALKLRETLYPSYPYNYVTSDIPVLEKGQHISVFRRLFPGPRAIWQATLDKNVRLPWAHTPWSRECFGERARTQRERQLEDAADIVVPVAQRDAAALQASLQGWLQWGFNVLNVASFFVPGLAEVMLVVGGAQLVDEFLEGVHAANENEADAAITHLFAVFAGLAQIAILGGAVHAYETAGPLHGWQRVGTGASERLWHGDLTPFSQPRPWPQDLPLPPSGMRHWQGQPWLELDGQALPLQASGRGRWRLAPQPGHRYQPSVLGNGAGSWVLEHERPLSWSASTLRRRLGPVSAGMDDATLADALACSGYDDAALRELLTDHKPLPALMLDSLEAFGADRVVPAETEGTAVLARDFPGLSPRARNEILAHATPAQRAQLQRTGRLPLPMAESARLYLRHARINRALASLRQVGGADADRDTLVFANLQRLPGWTGNVRLELREGGRLIQATGRPGATLKQVSRSLDGYEPSDAYGQVLANRSNLFHALLRALPDSERNALGLPIGDTDGLREAIYQLAVNDREGCARQLGMAPVRPLVRLPNRLPGSPGLGYRLSGRGRGWQSEDALFDELFPSAPERDRRLLRQHLRHVAGRRPGAFMRLLESMRSDYRHLDEDLQAWVEQGIGEQRTQRDLLAQQIRQAWRRQSTEGDIGDIDFVTLRLDLSELQSLPTLRSQLPQVRQLHISGLSARPPTLLDGFLRSFPGVRHLDLESNGLSALPAVLSELREVETLDLSYNELDLSQATVCQTLTSMPALRQLNLSHSITTLPVAAFEQLATLQSLRFLQLDSNALALGAEHFRALERLPALTHLELGRNAITLTEDSRTALASLNRLQLLSLRHNPLELAPDLTGWTQLEQLDLEHTGLQAWPNGLVELMNQTPLRLRAIDLSMNELTDAPDLRDTAFAWLIREDDQELTYAFDDNPFTDIALRSLEEAGLPVGGDMADTDWSSGWPSTLRAHLSELWFDPQWQPLHELYQRLPDTEAYVRSPGATNERMRHVMQTLVDGSQDDASWGFSELQQRINDLLNDAAQACVDQASLLFQQVETEVSLWQSVAHAAPGAGNEQVAVESASGLLRQQLLDERIGALFNARRARRTALGEGLDAPALVSYDTLSDEQLVDTNLPLDELEIALYARIRLQDRLRLPAQPEGMRFEYLARVSDGTLQAIAEEVWSAASASRLREWAGEQAFWQRWLQRLRPEAFDALQVEWEAASEYFDTLNEVVTAPGPYTGPSVPQGYIDSLETQIGQITWRQDGVLQRVDLSHDSGLYAQASALLLSSRQQAQTALIDELTTALSEANPQAFSPTDD
ncbi:MULTISPECIES: dermonecrotic toxin domain-containing protein [unclassified Pseudomonas]|uniref:dermonecrotic toxin domain-containing protein n=1 Tax=unclassified Pseudomonas TaxID=196821 RepID=UPI0021BACC06|nr:MULTISPECIES: DUF6543 domain-containing protein [unclassified Pseudomonas]